jgi:hypothetical protein
MVRDNVNDFYSKAESTPIILSEHNRFREGYFKGRGGRVQVRPFDRTFSDRRARPYQCRGRDRFGGLFSENAIGPLRSVAVRLTTNF